MLAGDVLDPVKAGPRGLWFVIEQFERLAERKIMVYWAGGDVDQPQHWPATLSLPPNVHVFSPARFDEAVHRRGGTPIARLCGTSRRDGREMWQIGRGRRMAASGSIPCWSITHPLSPPRARSPESTIRRWAAATSERRFRRRRTSFIFSGSPQGRHPREPGPHGCTLVYIDAAGQARTTSLTTDAVRFHDERLVIDETTSRDHLSAQIRLRARALAAEAEVPLLVTWKIDGRGSLVRQIRRKTFSSALVQSLRAEFGRGERIVWTLAIEADAPTALPAAVYEQETILGDYLRLIRDYQANPAMPLDLERFVHQRHVAGALGAATRVTDPHARQLVLQAAAELGADLLGGQ